MAKDDTKHNNLHVPFWTLQRNTIVDFHIVLRKLRGTSVEQSKNEPLERVNLMAGISIVVEFNSWTSSLCMKLLVALESRIAVNIVSYTPTLIN